MESNSSPPSAPSWKFKFCLGFMFFLMIILLIISIGVSVVPRAPKPLKYSDEKWIIQVERGWAPYSDESKEGDIVGFHKDLIEGVCKAGKLNCEVVMGPANACFTSDNDVTEGLAYRQYDGCAGWSITKHRANSADFTNTWTTIPNNGFYALKENQDFVTCTEEQGCRVQEGKVLGLVDGWSSSRACLVANGLIDDTHQPLLFSCGELVNKLREKVIDVFFIAMTDGDHHNKCLGLAADDDTVVRLADAGQHNCQEGGYAVATRPDSNLPAIWNKAFKKYTEAGSFSALCSQATYKDLIKTCCSDFSSPICK